MNDKNICSWCLEGMTDELIDIRTNKDNEKNIIFCGFLCLENATQYHMYS